MFEIGKGTDEYQVSVGLLVSLFFHFFGYSLWKHEIMSQSCEQNMNLNGLIFQLTIFVLLRQ